MTKIKLYNSNSESILINFGKDEVPGFETSILELNNVFFNWSCSRTISIEPNMGNLVIYGLDREIKDVMADMCEPIIGDEELTKALYSWDDNIESVTGGTFIGKDKFYQPVNLDEEKNDESKKIEATSKWKYRGKGWSKCAIYDDNNELLYVGDIVRYNDENDTVEMELGTAYNLLNLDYSQRVYRDTPNQSIVMNWLHGLNRTTNFFDKEGNPQPDQISVINPEAYVNLCERLIEGLQRIELYNDTKLAVDKTDAMWDNEVYAKRLEEIRKTISLSIGEVLVWDSGDKKNKKYKKGDKSISKKYREAYLLKGKFQEILSDLANKGVFLVFCDNDIFRILPFYETVNTLSDVWIDNNEAQPYHEGFSNVYSPVGNLNISVSEHERRAVFTQKVESLQRLTLSHGIKINRLDDLDVLDVYIDTIDISGDQNINTVTYSGRIGNFVYRGA